MALKQRKRHRKSKRAFQDKSHWRDIREDTAGFIFVLTFSLASFLISIGPSSSCNPSSLLPYSSCFPHPPLSSASLNLEICFINCFLYPSSFFLILAFPITILSCRNACKQPDTAY